MQFSSVFALNDMRIPATPMTKKPSPTLNALWTQNMNKSMFALFAFYFLFGCC